MRRTHLAIRACLGLAAADRVCRDGLDEVEVRAEDVAFAVDKDVAPAAALDMVELVMPDAMHRLEQQRMAKRDLADERRRQGR